MRDILPTLVRWRSEGCRVAIATVVELRGSAPRDPGASLALNERGEIAGSVTGGCVEPSVIREAQEVLDGGSARVREYGIADDEAFEVGLACGGTVGILIAKLDTSLLPVGLSCGVYGSLQCPYYVHRALTVAARAAGRARAGRADRNRRRVRRQGRIPVAHRRVMRRCWRARRAGRSR